MPALFFRLQPITPGSSAPKHAFMGIRISVAGSLQKPCHKSSLKFASIKGLFETISRRYLAQTVDRQLDICGLVDRERLGTFMLNRHPRLARYEEVQSLQWENSNVWPGWRTWRYPYSTTCGRDKTSLQKAKNPRVKTLSAGLSFPQLPCYGMRVMEGYQPGVEPRFRCRRGEFVRPGWILRICF